MWDVRSVLSDDINYFVKDVGRLIKSSSNYMRERERERERERARERERKRERAKERKRE